MLLRGSSKMGGSVEVRLLGPRIPPEGGDRGLPEASSSPLLSVVILGHWVIVSSCAFVVDRRPLVEHSSSKYTQAWEAVHHKRFWASRTFLL